MTTKSDEPKGTEHGDLEERVELRDCKATYLRSSGPGGQHKNKRDTGVRLVHLPTGTVVVATERRSQAQNRSLAFRRLEERVEKLHHRDPERVPTQVPAGVVERRRETKRKLSKQKSARRAPIPDE